MRRHLFHVLTATLLVVFSGQSLNAQSELNKTVRQVINALSEKDITTLGTLYADSLLQAKTAYAELGSSSNGANQGNRQSAERVLRVIDRYKVSIQDKPFETIKVPDEPDSQLLIYKVKVAIGHRDFAQLQFFLIEHKSAFFLDATSVKLLDPAEAGAEEAMEVMEILEDSKGGIVLEGSLKLSHIGRSSKEVNDCFMKNAMFRLIHTETSQNAQGDYINTGFSGGRHNDRDQNSTFLGAVTYDFQYTFSSDTFHFRYSGFLHNRRADTLTPDKSSDEISPFESLGTLKMSYNDLPKTAITEQQYQYMRESITRQISEFVGILKYRGETCLYFNRK